VPAAAEVATRESDVQAPPIGQTVELEAHFQTFSQRIGCNKEGWFVKPHSSTADAIRGQ
jgi:hypothetical protein